jgi:hypothetical protein
MLLNKRSVLRAVSKQIQILTSQRNNFSKVVFLRNNKQTKVVLKERDLAEEKFEEPHLKSFFETAEEVYGKEVINGKVEAKQHEEVHHEEGEGHHGEHDDHHHHGHHHHDAVTLFLLFTTLVSVRKWS